MATAMITDNSRGLYPQIGDLENGDTIWDFRDDPWILDGISRLPEPGRSGKVEVHDPRDPNYTREFYHTVFPGLELIDE